MSKNRVSPSKPRSADKRGPNGRRLCAWCGTEVKPPKIRWCSQKCVDEAWLRKSSSFMRWKVEERDRGVCSRCRLDTRALLEAAKKLAVVWQKRTTKGYYFAEIVVSEKRILDRGHLWEAHHKIAVVEGGGECGLDGMETLCIWCHTTETAELQRRLSKAKSGRTETASLPGIGKES